MIYNSKTKGPCAHGRKTLCPAPRGPGTHPGDAGTQTGQAPAAPGTGSFAHVPMGPRF